MNGERPAEEDEHDEADEEAEGERREASAVVAS